jgi:hypothetical protein
MMFAALGLWVIGYSMGPSLLKRERLRRQSNSPSSRTDLGRLAAEEFERNSAFSNECQRLESELKKVADKMEQDMLTASEPNPSFKRGALKRAP